MANIWEDPSAYGYNKNLSPNPLGGGSINGYDTYVPGGGARSAPSGDTGSGTGVYMNGKEISVSEVGDFLKNNPMNSVDDMSRAINSGKMAGLSSVDISNLRSYARENYGFNPNYGVGAMYNPNAGTLMPESGADSGGPTNTASGNYGGGSSNLGFGGSSSSTSGGQNPYLSQMADDIGRRSNLALGQGLQSIQSNAIGVGGLGGSRQGVAQGQAIGLANDSLTGNLANLYGNSWNAGENRQVQTNGQNQNFYTNNRQLDQSGMRLGADLYSMGNAGNLSQGSGVAQLGTQQQNANQGVYDNVNSNISPYTGYGATNTSTNTSGGGVNGAVGGALSAMQIGRNLGLGGGNSTTANSAGGVNSYGWGTGAGYGNQDYGQYF